MAKSGCKECKLCKELFYIYLMRFRIEKKHEISNSRSEENEVVSEDSTKKQDATV